MPAAPAGGSLGRSISRGRAVERGDGRQEEEEEEEYGGTLALKARRLVHGAAWRRLRPSRLFSIMAVVYRSHLRNHTQPNFTTLLRRPGAFGSSVDSAGYEYSCTSCIMHIRILPSH
jgi:hypothetical protein